MEIESHILTTVNSKWTDPRTCHFTPVSLDKWLGGFQRRSGGDGNEKNSYPCWGSNSSRTVRSLAVAHATIIPQNVSRPVPFPILRKLFHVIRPDISSLKTTNHNMGIITVRITLVHCHTITSYSAPSNGYRGVPFMKSVSCYWCPGGCKLSLR